MKDSDDDVSEPSILAYSGSEYIPSESDEDSEEYDSDIPDRTKNDNQNNEVTENDIPVGANDNQNNEVTENDILVGESDNQNNEVTENDIPVGANNDNQNNDNENGEENTHEDATGNTTRRHKNKRPKQTTRKRVRGESSKEKRKRFRNCGEEYTTSKGKKIEKKKFENIPCSCKLKCHEKISEENRKKLFEAFYKTGCYKTQNAFLTGLCHQSTPAIRRPRKGTVQRKQSVRYYLKAKMDVEEHELQTFQVCKKYFLNTFMVSNGRMQRLLQKNLKGIEPGNDNRGKHVPANKTPDEATQIVREHISSFPTVTSHYTRHHNPNRRYLSPGLNVREMYNQYLEHCKDINCDNPVSENIYRKIFNTQFNLHFKHPRKDTCKKCDLYKMKISTTISPEEKAEAEIEHEVHLRKAESARTDLDSLKVLCQSNKKVYGLSFDLQKALPFPKLSVSIAYYKRNMYIYNLGCHELSSGSAYMYAWDETTGSRGTEEIISCVLHHIQQVVVPTECEQVVMFSDSCGGQNRSINTAVACMRFLQQHTHNIKIIDHKFMVTGHSYLPNDADFGVIETFSKSRPIFDPQDWYDVILKCKKKNPYHLKVMSQSDFFSVKKLLQAITKRKKNNLKQPVSWLQIQWLRYKKDEPYKIFYKESLNKDMAFCEINVKPRCKRGRPTTRKLARIPLLRLYTNRRPVKDDKKKDMDDLLPFIPPVKHAFFENLNASEDAPEECPLSNSDESEESEGEVEDQTDGEASE